MPTENEETTAMEGTEGTGSTDTTESPTDTESQTQDGQGPTPEKAAPEGSTTGEKPDWLAEALDDLSPEDRERVESKLRSSKKLQGMDAGYHRTLNKEREKIQKENEAWRQQVLSQMLDTYGKSLSGTTPQPGQASPEDPWTKLSLQQEDGQALRQAVESTVHQILGQ